MVALLGDLNIWFKNFGFLGKNATNELGTLRDLAVNSKSILKTSLGYFNVNVVIFAAFVRLRSYEPDLGIASLLLKWLYLQTVNIVSYALPT